MPTGQKIYSLSKLSHILHEFYPSSGEYLSLPSCIYICIYGTWWDKPRSSPSERVRVGKSSRWTDFSASNVESLPWNGWNIENDDYYDNLWNIYWQIGSLHSYVKLLKGNDVKLKCGNQHGKLEGQLNQGFRGRSWAVSEDGHRKKILWPGRIIYKRDTLPVPDIPDTEVYHRAKHGDMKR